jgi:threonine dehydrogenase-like Zn-dependent dehydrogenase
MVRRPCPHPECPGCSAGRQDFCSTGDYAERGIKDLHGFLTELVVDEERFLIAVPPALREVAVLTEPLTIAEKALTQVWQVQERLPWSLPVGSGERPAIAHRAVVLGAGPVGLLGAMVLVAEGFATTVYSRASGSPQKALIAEAIGARFVSAETHTVEQLAASVGSIDLIYEATGASRISFDAMRALGANGVFIFTGVPGRKGPIDLDADLIMRNLVLRNQVVFGTVNAGRDAYLDAVAHLQQFQQRWPEALRALITGRFAMERAPDLLQADPSGIKNVIVPA